MKLDVCRWYLAFSICRAQSVLFNYSYRRYSFSWKLIAFVLATATATASVTELHWHYIPENMYYTWAFVFIIIAHKEVSVFIAHSRYHSFVLMSVCGGIDIISILHIGSLNPHTPLNSFDKVVVQKFAKLIWCACVLKSPNGMCANYYEAKKS